MISKISKGQNIRVEFADDDPSCSYTGPATFDHYLDADWDGLWKYAQMAEPHCVVFVPGKSFGCCFPVSCVFADAAGRARSKCPVRVQLSRRKGWRMPPNTVMVCRPGQWGNPWKVGRDGTPADCVARHRADLLSRAPSTLAAQLSPLRGKNLACWCKIGTPCHGDTLLELANKGRTFDAPKETP